MDERGKARPAGNDLDLVWGCEGISREINRTPRQTFHLLETGALDGAARKIQNRWVAERGKLRAIFVGEAA